VETKGNLKLCALKSMQMKNTKYKNYPSPILKQSTIIHRKKAQRSGAKDNNFTRLGVECAYARQRSRCKEHQPLHLYFRTWQPSNQMPSRHVEACKLHGIGLTSTVIREH